MRIWLDPEQARHPRSDRRRRGRGAARAERAGRRRRDRPAAGADAAAPSSSTSRPTAASPTPRPVRRHHRQDRHRRPRGARARRRPGRARRARTTPRNSYLDGKVAVAARRSSSGPARTRSPPPTHVQDAMEKLSERFPAGPRLRHRLQPDRVHRAVGRRAVIKTMFEAVVLVVIVVILFLQTWRAAIIPIVAIPVSLIGTFAVHGGARLLAQQPLAVRPRARHRHRGRRRHRRGGERRAQHPRGPQSARRRATRPWRRSAAR